jgi:hypothetical protein
MITRYRTGTRTVVEQARRQMSCVAPIRDDEFEQVVYELMKSNPEGTKQLTVSQIVEAATRYWSTGLSCC